MIASVKKHNAVNGRRSASLKVSWCNIDWKAMVPPALSGRNGDNPSSTCCSVTHNVEFDRRAHS